MLKGLILEAVRSITASAKFHDRLGNESVAGALRAVADAYLARAKELPPRNLRAHLVLVAQTSEALAAIDRVPARELRLLALERARA